MIDIRTMDHELLLCQWKLTIESARLRALVTGRSIMQRATEDLRLLLERRRYYDHGLPNHWAVEKRTFEGLIDHYWKVTIRTTGRSTGSLIGRYKDH